MIWLYGTISSLYSLLPHGSHRQDGSDEDLVFMENLVFHYQSRVLELSTFEYIKDVETECTAIGDNIQVETKAYASASPLDVPLRVKKFGLKGIYSAEDTCPSNKKTDC